MASKLDAPDRPTEWHTIDRIGLALQLMAAIIFLFARGSVFCLLSDLNSPWSGLSITGVLQNVTGRDLLLAPFDEVAPVAAIGLAVFWLVWESLAGPWVMERLRRLPATVFDLPPPVTWRADTFYVVWRLQSAALAVYILVSQFQTPPL